MLLEEDRTVKSKVFGEIIETNKKRIILHQDNASRRTFHRTINNFSIQKIKIMCQMTSFYELRFGGVSNRMDKKMKLFSVTKFLFYYVNRLKI